MILPCEKDMLIVYGLRDVDAKDRPPALQICPDGKVYVKGKHVSDDGKDALDSMKFVNKTAWDPAMVPKKHLPIAGWSVLALVVVLSLNGGVLLSRLIHKRRSQP